MSERDIFPHEQDRLTIKAFLAGVHHHHDDAFIQITPSTLVIDRTLQVLWIAPTDRALYATVPNGMRLATAVRAINYALELLDIPERIDLGDRPLHFAGDRIAPGQPFLIVGPLGLEAHRAAVLAGAASR